jgi:hypothetical protein
MRELDPDHAVEISRLNGIISAVGAEAGSNPVAFA